MALISPIGSENDPASGVSEGGRQGVDTLDAIVGRKSIRRFRSDAVATECISKILTAASRAPSGVNSQPWFVHVVVGAAKERLSRAVKAAANAGATSLEYDYMPALAREPYLSRRRKVGYDLYALYGIDRHDRTARQAAMLRNFDFFGAPVGLFFTMDRELAFGSWLDMGMFMQNVMVLARAYGLETCPQQAWCDYGAVVRRELDIPVSQLLVSGMAIGHADYEAIENSLVTERAPVREFSRFHET